MQGVECGKAIGTGAVMPVTIGFNPKRGRVELFCSESSIRGFWDSSMRDGTFCIEQCNELRAGDVLLGAHLPSIGTTDTQLANKRVVAQHNGAGDVRVECTATAAGTAFTVTDHDITAALWACYMLCVTTGSAYTIVRSGATWGAVGGYATEALAIAAMPTKTANSASLGYITVQATAGAIFNATTDGLAGGTTGTAAAITKYYAGYGIMTNGITPKGGGSDTFMGFNIGTDAGINVLGSEISYKVYRS